MLCRLLKSTNKSTLVDEFPRVVVVQVGPPVSAVIVFYYACGIILVGSVHGHHHGVTRIYCNIILLGSIYVSVVTYWRHAESGAPVRRSVI